jgi:hypothetical protein
MGWAWMFAESIFLERNWEKDKQTIGRQIKELVEHPDPIWVCFIIAVLKLFTVTSISIFQVMLCDQDFCW